MLVAVLDRDDDAVLEEVVTLWVGKPQFLKELLLQGQTSEGFAVDGRKTYLNLVAILLPPAVVGIVLGWLIAQEHLTVMLMHSGIDNQQRLAFQSLLLLVDGFLSFLHLDAVLPAQPPDGLRVGHVLMLHQEGDHVASLMAAETVEHAAVGRNGKRRCLLLVERAQGTIDGATLLERQELAHHIFYMCRVEYLFYDGLGYHLIL